MAMAREASPGVRAGASTTDAGEAAGEAGGETPAAASVDVSALETEEASQAEILKSAKKIAAPKPKLEGGSLSGLGSGGAGVSSGSPAAAGAAGAKTLLAAARPAGGSTLTQGGAAGVPSARRRFGDGAGGKRLRAGSGSGGAGGAHRTSLSKLRNMNRNFKGASGGDANATYETQKMEWDGGRPLQGAGGGEEPSGDGRRGPMSSSHGDDSGRPLGPASSSDEDYYGSSSRKRINGTNVTPYQQMVDMAQALLMLASALLTLSFIFGLLAKFMPAAGKALYAVAKYLAYAAAAVAAVVTLLGLGIMMQGQTTQGAVFTGVGALLTILSYVSAEGYGEAADAAGAAKGKAAEKGATAAAKLAKPSLWTSGIGGAAGFGGAAATNSNEAGWAEEQKKNYGG